MNQIVVPLSNKIEKLDAYPMTNFKASCKPNPPKIQQVSSHEGSLTFIGESLPCGCYVLRFHVPERLKISRGGFKKGKIVTFEPGDHLYVGSGMAKSGPSSLAGRLIRHATRLYEYPPHPIRELMVAQFPLFGLGHHDIGGTKNPHWNVDWPLNQLNVRLTAVYAIRTLWNFEGHLAKFLENDPATVVFERRLGGNDFTDTTHLMRVEADEAWWNRMPEKLATFLPHGEGLARLTLRFGATVVTPTIGFHLTDRHLKTLRGRWHQRSAEILRLMATGRSFDDAYKNTEHIYDTTRWVKVPSRLSRGRGNVFKALSNLETRWASLITNSSQPPELIALAEELRADANVLRHVMTSFSTPVTETGELPEPTINTDRLDSFNFVRGNLRQCRRFLKKNIHDVPLIGKMLGTTPTQDQINAVHRELTWIESGVGRLLEIYSCKSLHPHGGEVEVCDRDDR